MKKVLIITCSGFTSIVMLFALFSTFDMVPQPSKSVILQLFTMALSIAVLMFISEKVEDRLSVKSSLAVDALIKVFICYIVVFVEGCLFGMLSWGWLAIVNISPVLIPAFIITYVIGYFTIVEHANAINKRIIERKNYKT